jgi:hypothetical protein
MSNNLFNEVQRSWFSLKPYQKNSYASRAVFQHVGLDMNNVFHISDIATVTVGYYNFFVTLTSVRGGDRVQEFIFERKTDVVKAHREFCRAYMQLEEFDYDRQDTPREERAYISKKGEQLGEDGGAEL